MRAKQKTKKRKWLRITGIFFLLLLIGTGVYGFSVYKSFTSAIDTMHEPVVRENSDKRTEEVTLNEERTFFCVNVRGGRT